MYSNESVWMVPGTVSADEENSSDLFSGSRNRHNSLSRAPARAELGTGSRSWELSTSNRE
jgi:hypothetical protein